MSTASHSAFSMFLRVRLDETGMTQQEFAAHCGLSQSYVSRLTSGHSRPTAKICRLLDDKLIMTPAQRTEFYRLAAEARGYTLP